MLIKSYKNKIQGKIPKALSSNKYKNLFSFPFFEVKQSDDQGKLNGKWIILMLQPCVYLEKNVRERRIPAVVISMTEKNYINKLVT